MNFQHTVHNASAWTLRELSVFYRYVFCMGSCKEATIVLGMAFNIFASGITAYLFNAIYGPEGTPFDTPKLPDVKIPVIDKIPIIGQILTGQNVMVYIMFVLIILSQWFLFKSCD